MRSRVITIGAFLLSSSSAYALQSSVPSIHADQVHAQGITGAGVTVAVVDTGIDYNEPGLAGSIEDGGASFEGPTPQADAGVDV